MKSNQGIPVGWLVLMVLAVLPLPVSAQNGYSFIDAGSADTGFSDTGSADTDSSSIVDYRVADISPVGVCGDFVAQSDINLSVIAARMVPAEGEVGEHCRVDGIIAPEVRFQVNLPSNWNGRFYMHGNGGYAGLSPEHPTRSAYRDEALSQGFATAYTNTGHDADALPLGSFAHNNQAREIDFAFRAVHLTAQTARQMVSDYYGEPSAYSYWDGCSTGGRQGLMSAQRFPEDFDGIVVGAPVLNFTDTQLWGVWNARALHDAPISQQQIAAVGEAIYARCDAIDGLDDGLIDDPRNCDFEPASDLPRCDAFDSEAVCFSDEQVDALTKIYRGVESKGEIIFPGQPMGAEKGGGWDEWLIASKGPSRQLLYGHEFLKYLAFPADDPDYDWLQFDFDEGPSKIVEIRKFLDATDPDLSAFRDRGGKIISYFGWADTALTAQMGVDYYEAVLDEMGNEAAKDFYRFFLVPGMFHCRGGIGVDRIDIMTPLINWVEQGVAPDVIVGGREEGGEIVRTRPLCPYPQVARHDGSGSIDVASSFSCSAP